MRVLFRDRMEMSEAQAGRREEGKRCPSTGKAGRESTGLRS